MTYTYRSHCSNWHDTDLFKITGELGSLTLENVVFENVRAQYRSLIYMDNSSNLVMVNTHFDKV